MSKRAATDHPVHRLISDRWSPYAYSERSVPDSDLVSLFEAARWAPSSFNEQPWSYILAKREEAGEFEKLLSCLTEGNQAWAKSAAALALGIVRLRFSRNDRPNRHARHDLGLASANLSLEATARGITVHQMAGIVPDRARELYAIPEGAEAVTGMAIGYPADSGTAPEELVRRDESRRPRNPLKNMVFAGRWEQPAPLVKK